MKNKRMFYRLSVIFLIGIMVLLPSQQLWAQDELPQGLCDELADEDCLLFGIRHQFPDTESMIPMFSLQYRYWGRVSAQVK